LLKLENRYITEFSITTSETVDNKKIEREVKLHLYVNDLKSNFNVLLGYTYHHEQKYEEAIRYYAQALQFNKSNLLALNLNSQINIFIHHSVFT